MNGLLPLILFLQLSLHIEIELSLSLYALLLHVANDAFVHCLPKSQSWTLYMDVRSGSSSDGLEQLGRSQLTCGNSRTAFSAFCWKWTITTVLAAKSDVAAKVSFEARDIAPVATQGINNQYVE